MSRRMLATAIAAVTTAAVLPGALAATATAAPRATEKSPVAIGSGGAAATVDPEATRAALEVLAKGGNAVDAAVTAAAVLGVTEPYSAGIGGGGFFVYYDADSGDVHTIDGRETAPMAMQVDAFVENGRPIPFGEAVTSGLGVGVPGTLLTWQRALDEWGTLSLQQALQPGRQVAARGFVVDTTFRQQTADNEERFRDITSTREVFLPGGVLPRVGTLFRNPDLANTYAQIGAHGADWFYDGPLAAEIVRTVQQPPVEPSSTRNVRPGMMEESDLAGYAAPLRDPTHVAYRGLDVFGMAPPSSGGSTVGEALNILENFDLSSVPVAQALHVYLESGALAFADRNRFVGDEDFVDVPLAELLSDGFAAERACEIDPASALPKPVMAGSPDGDYDTSCDQISGAREAADHGVSTTHLTTADRWGNVVAYTLTIEQTGGSGIVVPGRGFLLNNELTDFNFLDTQGGADPNLPAPGKRPRSSMSPTIVLNGGEPFLALGSPGGSTIITTVLQALVNRLDLGMTLPDAIAAPRASQRNTPSVLAEPDFIATYGPALGEGGFGHRFTSTSEIGAATGIEFLADGRLLAAAEPVRRGGGSAGVVTPASP